MTNHDEPLAEPYRPPQPCAICDPETYSDPDICDYCSGKHAADHASALVRAYRYAERRREEMSGYPVAGLSIAERDALRDELSKPGYAR